MTISPNFISVNFSEFLQKKWWCISVFVSKKILSDETLTDFRNTVMSKLVEAIIYCSQRNFVFFSQLLYEHPQPYNDCYHF